MKTPPGRAAKIMSTNPNTNLQMHAQKASRSMLMRPLDAEPPSADRSHRQKGEKEPVSNARGMREKRDSR